MATAIPRLKLEIIQGATFRKTLYWYSGEDIVKPITAIARGYPTIVTAVAHGLPASAVPSSIIGCDWLNTASLESADRVYATKTGVDTFSIKFDSTAKAAYVSGGNLIYTPPVNLTGYTADMQLRANVGATAVIKDLSTTLGTIVLGADGSIELIISAVDTAALTFTAATSQLELKETATGDITRLFSVDWTLNRESTR